LMLSIAQPEAERIDAVFDLLHAPLLSHESVALKV